MEETAEVKAVLEDGFPSEAAVQELHHRIRSSRVVPLVQRLEPDLGRRRRRPPALRHRGRRASVGARGPPGVGAEVDDGGRRSQLLPRGGRALARVFPVVGDLVRRRLVLRLLHPPRRVASLVLVRAAVVEPAEGLSARIGQSIATTEWNGLSALMSA